MTKQPDARVILSFDFEIGWGDVTNPRWRSREAKGVYVKLRKVLPEMLREMDTCGFAATFATVGAMVDRRESRDFSHLPTTYQKLIADVLDEAQPESFNGRDLFEMVIGADTSHRIACHSYSHVPFTYEGMTSKVVGEDLNRFQSVMDDYNLVADRFVFPENREAHYDALAEAGYVKARVAADNYFKNRALYLASTMILPPPPGREEPGEAAIVRQYGSMLFNDAGKGWRTRLLNRRLSLGLGQLHRTGGDFHIWAHPFNFAESDALKAGFLKMIQQIARLRDKGVLEIELM